MHSLPGECYSANRMECRIGLYLFVDIYQTKGSGSLNEEFTGIALFSVIFLLAVLVGTLMYLGEQRRSAAFRAMAKRYGLKYHKKSRGIPKQFEFLDKLCQGHSRYAFNILDGIYQGRQVLLFDYHYATGSGKSHADHYFSFFMLRLDRSFPELIVTPENLFSKMGQWLGFSDINFESVEFSKKFNVRSKDRKFAYDICHPRMMEYLLKRPEISFEIEKDWLAMGAEKRLKPEELPQRLDDLLEIRSLFPEYLFV